MSIVSFIHGRVDPNKAYTVDIKIHTNNAYKPTRESNAHSQQTLNLGLSSVSKDSNVYGANKEIKITNK